MSISPSDRRKTTALTPKQKRQEALEGSNVRDALSHEDPSAAYFRPPQTPQQRPETTPQQDTRYSVEPERRQQYLHITPVSPSQAARVQALRGDGVADAMGYTPQATTTPQLSPSRRTAVEMRQSPGVSAALKQASPGEVPEMGYSGIDVFASPPRRPLMPDTPISLGRATEKWSPGQPSPPLKLAAILQRYGIKKDVPTLEAVKQANDRVLHELAHRDPVTTGATCVLLRGVESIPSGARAKVSELKGSAADIRVQAAQTTGKNVNLFGVDVKLLRKQPDVRIRQSGQSFPTYNVVRQPLLPTGRPVSHKDVIQGKLGDCWLLSALAGLAKQNPEVIAQLIAPEPDLSYLFQQKTRGAPTTHYEAVDVYSVSLPGTRGPILVDTFFPVTTPDAKNAPPSRVPEYAGHPTSSAESDVLWPSMLEKACVIAQNRGGYAAISNLPRTGQLDVLRFVFESATEKNAGQYDISTIQAALSAKKVVTAVTDATGTKHAIAVIGTKDDGSIVTYDQAHGTEKDYPATDFYRIFKSINLLTPYTH